MNVSAPPEAAAGTEGGSLPPSCYSSARSGGAYVPSSVPSAKATAASLSAPQDRRVSAPSGPAGGRQESCMLIAEEDVGFLFAAMSWNADLLEVLLSKAPNPLHGMNACNPQQEELMDAAAGRGNANALARLAFPTIEEVLLTASSARGGKAAKAMTGSSINRNRPPGVKHNRRGKRRKIGRGRAVRLPFEPVFLRKEEWVESEDFAYYHDSSNDESVNITKEECETYTTEEKESHMNSSNPFPPLEECNNTHLGADADADISSNAASKSSKCFLPTSISSNEEEKEPTGGTMRHFLKVFFQSFIIVVSAKLRCEEHHDLIHQQSRSLSSVEYRALAFVRRHLGAFKEIFRQHVMGKEKELERRGVQSLLVDAFQPDEEREGKDEATWKPLCSQVYISGKDPVHQPLLLDVLCISRVVQCYANLSVNGDNDSENMKKNEDITLNVLHSWKRLLLEELDNNINNIESGVERMNSLFLCKEEEGMAYELFKKCLSPLFWDPYRAFGPYMVYIAQLPYSRRSIVKLVLPAEDRETYDLSQHFQEGVFRFIHGTPFFPFDVTETVLNENSHEPSPRPCSLVHCSAGMHRSSGMAAAYLLWLVSLSRGKLPILREVNDSSLQRQKVAEKEQQSAFSYLFVVLRQHAGKHPNSTVTTTPADAIMTMTTPLPAAEGGGLAKASKVEKNTHILETCMEHVRRRRSMAVPIAAVQEHLRRYAFYLRLK